MAVATVREPVPVFNFFQYGKPYSRYIFPYPFFISSRTGNHIDSQYLPNPYPKPNPNPNANHNPNHSRSRTGRNEKLVREDF